MHMNHRDHFLQLLIAFLSLLTVAFLNTAIIFEFPCKSSCFQYLLRAHLAYLAQFNGASQSECETTVCCQHKSSGDVN